MPGQIKIDDGAGNYTILTNAGSLGSDKTITIPNTTGTMALTSDVPAGNTAFDEIDLWEWSANITASANHISANLQRKSYTLMTYPKGTGMSVSSGLWTFPSTGFYEVRIAGIFIHQANSNSVQLYIYATDDNNSTSEVISKDDNRAGSNTWTYFDLATTVKISNTSNDKVFFRLNIGGTTPAGTFYSGSNCIISFKKLGDI